MSLEKVWNSMFETYLGGDIVSTCGTVRGVPAMGTTGDLLKASGEIRVHLVRPKGEPRLVTVELPQHEVPGDTPEMVCVRLTAPEAARLGEILCQAADAALAPALRERRSPDPTDRR